MRVEVDEADRPVGGRARANVRLRDRVVAAEHDRDRGRSEHLTDRRLDCLVRPSRVGRQHRSVAEVDHLQLREGVDLRIEMRAGRAARCPDRPRPEARPGPIGDEIVCGRANDGDVHPLELGRILGVRKAAEGK
jgi:hypothetical protein